ncbi:thioesterase-like superfamily-domain-containing protein [Hyaloraphidium curvatum]|nr:thioesterase-like superfamily-domain-containing protein [Hyaloraphidium curvatum]
MSAQTASMDDVTFAESMSQLEEIEPGTYRAAVPPVWSNGIGAAHGGWLLALNLNAVLKETAKVKPNLQHPLSVTSQYLAPAHPRDGLISVTARVLRHGKRFAFAQSTTVNGKNEIALVATFCIGEAVKAPGVPAAVVDFGPQLSIEQMRMPEMIPPDACVEFSEVYMKGRPRFRPGGRLRPLSVILSDPRFSYFVNRRTKLPIDGGLMDMPALSWVSFANEQAHDALSLTYWSDGVLPPNLHVSVGEAYRRLAREAAGKDAPDEEILAIGWSTLSLQVHYPHPITPGVTHVLARSEIELASPTSGTGLFSITIWDPVTGNVVCVGRQSVILPVIRRKTKFDASDRSVRAGVNVEEEDVVSKL